MLSVARRVRGQLGARGGELVRPAPAQLGRAAAHLVEQRAALGAVHAHLAHELGEDRVVVALLRVPVVLVRAQLLLVGSRVRVSVRVRAWVRARVRVRVRARARARARG